MGDRCWLSMTIHPDDLAKAIEQNTEIQYLDAFELERIEYEMEEVNYGGLEDRELLAKAGVRFYGSHTDGAEYSACDFFADGKKNYEWPTDNHGGCAITLTRDASDENAPPTLNVHDVADCERFLAAEFATRKLIDAAAKAWSPPPDPWDELDQAALDELVHQAWSEGASQINNQGRAKQIAWLKNRGVTP